MVRHWVTGDKFNYEGRHDLFYKEIPIPWNQMSDENKKMIADLSSYENEPQAETCSHCGQPMFATRLVIFMGRVCVKWRCGWGNCKGRES